MHTKALSIILVAALASTTAFAAKPFFYTPKQKSYSNNGPIKQKPLTPEERKLAEEEKYDVGKMAQRLKNGSK